MKDYIKIIIIHKMSIFSYAIVPTSILVRLISSRALLGPLSKRMCLSSKGSIGGTFNSGMPVINFPRNCSIELRIHLLTSGSFRLHTLIYGAIKNMKLA